MILTGIFVFFFTSVHICISQEETFLENFDHRILRELKYPIPTNGQHLYQNMLQYYSDLLDMLNMIKINNPKVKNYARGLITQGGPKLLRYPFNLTELENTYSWNKEQVTDFNSAFTKIKTLWSKIEHTLPPEEDSDSDDYSYSDGSSDSGSYDWI
uniref:Angiotensin-converting enzyme n=1 Tax=Graphocephala atropunctata TaxID=36148 RepID=A0A1B6MLF5_9HEMI